MTTHVICPDIDGLPEYLTAGKRYEARPEPTIPGFFYIRADDDLDHCIRLQGCCRLNGADWIVDDGSLRQELDAATEAVSKWPQGLQDSVYAAPSPTWETVGPELVEASLDLCLAAEAARSLLHACDVGPNVRRQIGEYVDAVQAALSLAEQIKGTSVCKPGGSDDA
jgi:hypothetical protein